jgi:hypothetical protein
MSNEFIPALMPRDPAVVAAAEGAKARIQAAYIMAMQRPRSEDQARSKILEACKRPLFAERVEYAKPVGKRTIKGPSVRFAELALREWQNVLTETQVIYEDDGIRRIRVMVLDLETNSQFSKDIQIRKTVERRNPEGRELIRERMNTSGEKVYIVAATEDELQNKEAALISKAFRTEGLRLIPSDIVDEALDVARATLRDRDSKDPKEAKKKVLDAFDSIGIKPKDIAQLLKHSLDTVSPAEMETLRGIYRAIRDGESSWADYLRVQAEDEGEGGDTSADSLTAKIKEATTKKRGRPPKEPEKPPDNAIKEEKPLFDVEELASPLQNLRNDILQCKELLEERSWNAIVGFYRSWEKSEDLDSLNAMLKQCRSTIDKQNQG